MTSSGARFDGPGLSLGLAASVPLRRDGDGRGRPTSRSARARAPRSSCGCIDPDDDAGHCPGTGEAEERFRETVAYWQRWLLALHLPGRWREMVQRSALALKLLTYEPTGAIVAAPTTSLPEGDRRRAELGLPLHLDPRRRVHAVRASCGSASPRRRPGSWTGWPPAGRSSESHCDGPLQLMYGIDGRSDLTEEELPHLDGYRGSRPVRIGNAAHGQLQLDIYGELMDAVYLYNKYAAPIGYDAWRHLRRLVDWVGDNWQREDEGIWEVRGGRRHFVYSQVHVLGGAGPRPAAGGQAVVPGRPGALAEGPRRDLRGGDGEGLEPRARGVRAGVRLATPWTPRPC